MCMLSTLTLIFTPHLVTIKLFVGFPKLVAFSTTVTLAVFANIGDVAEMTLTATAIQIQVYGVCILVQTASHQLSYDVLFPSSFYTMIIPRLVLIILHKFIDHNVNFEAIFYF